MHSHSTLAYLMFLVAMGNLLLVLTKGRTDPAFAGWLRWSHSIGILWAGRLNLLLGAGLTFTHESYTSVPWWAAVAVVLWMPVEVLGKRLVKPEVSLVQDGGQASGRLAIGAAGQLIIIAIIFGLMSARP